MADVMMQAFEKHGAGGRDNAYKDSKIGRSLLSCTDILQRNHEGLKAINKQFLVK